MNNYFGGAIESQKDERDFLFSDTFSGGLEEKELPLIIEMKKVPLFLESQGKRMSCTAESCTNAIESTFFLMTGVSAKIDALDQWHYQINVHPKTGSEKNGDFTKSSGISIVHRSEKEGGITAETEKLEKIKIMVSSFSSLAMNDYSFRRAISENYSIQISGDILINEKKKSNFHNAKENGILRFNKKNKKIGGHAVCCVVGYDFSLKEESFPFFWVGNSYGETWGKFKNGCVKLPADEIKNLHNGAYIFHIENTKKKLEDIKKAKAALAFCRTTFERIERINYLNIPFSIELKNSLHDFADSIRKYLSS